MIRVEGNDDEVKVEIKGTEPILLAELSTIIRSLKENIKEELIEKAVELGFAEDEELNEKVKETLHQKLDELFEFLEMDKDDKDEMDGLLDRLRQKFNKKDK